MTFSREKRVTGHILTQPVRLWLVLGALVLVTACRQDVPPDPAASTAANEPSSAAGKEIWDAFYLQGAKIGYGHTSTQNVTRDGRSLVEIRSTNHLVLTRFNQRTEQEVQAQTLETPEGEVLEFKTEVAFGPSPTIATGRVTGEQMEITVQTEGRRDTTRIPWSPEIRGFRGTEQSLVRQPMKPGEKRSLRMLMPLLNQVADVELQARDFEDTKLGAIQVRLLRVDGITKFPGGQIASTMWIDAQGDVAKTLIASLGQETIRTTRALAIAPGSEKAFDLGLDSIVKIEPPLERAHETRQVRYRVELAEGDPAKTFASGPTQSIGELAGPAAELTVRSVRPRDVAKRTQPATPVSPQYTSANSILQVDDPRIQKMAHEAKGKATDPIQIALALESYVHRIVGEKNFSQGFATAAEVAESREGDCTEHAVLLAALARACGIPSRVAIGLVYVDRLGGFGYHMWTEVYLNGQWVPLDAMMGQGGISAAYLKLTDSSLDGASAYGSFLAVAGVLGQLKVSVIEAK